ncbi:hypothetical protein BS47DRAFT_1368786 [Hydnum rufescens UP504]|uniref:Uncharacterized protein n=1 Tax=Hydnum rufescens UP504 TaxID=1448309 RepID=A0A9P6AFK7_9AGAM|nr:hypothetical protein BS47DRAFT_1368786 [Hydnum rufescens UP504]
MPGVAPLALAAIPLPPSTSKASELVDPLLNLIWGFHSKKINMELKLNDQFNPRLRMLPNRQRYTCLRTHRVNKDSKHLQKTLRNNIFSGARSLIVGDYHVAYHQLREIALDNTPGCQPPPLYPRDLTETGLHALLFVFGDLMDACQNHSFFLDIWKVYLERADYDVRHYFVSRESMDIVGIVVNGIISLILVYHDFSSGLPDALLLWLHSTEPTEHCFAEIRKLCPDFSLLNFHHMIQGAIDTAYQESHHLMQQLGFIYNAVAPTKLSRPILPSIKTLPSFVKTIQGLPSDNIMDDNGNNDDNDSSKNDGDVSGYDSLNNDVEDGNVAADLAEQISHLCSEQLEWSSQNDVADTVIFATASLDMDQDAKIQALEDELAELFRQTGVWIGNLLVDNLPPVLEPNVHISAPHRMDMSSKHLLELHRAHQTREAAEGCKEKLSMITDSRISEHHKILVKLNDILWLSRSNETAEKNQHQQRWEQGTSGAGNSSNAAIVKLNSSSQMASFSLVMV